MTDRSTALQAKAECVWGHAMFMSNIQDICIVLVTDNSRFDLSRVQPQKEWWRERRVAPATFFGFPDVTKAGMRGGSMYTEQMDAVTLAVLADKCVQENVWDPEMWLKFSWRAQQLSTRTQEPDLCYIFRAFARADWFDQNLLTTYLGRLHRRLPQFQLPDVAVLLEAFENPRFRQGEYLQRSLTHMALLLQPVQAGLLLLAEAWLYLAVVSCGDMVLSSQVSSMIRMNRSMNPERARLSLTLLPRAFTTCSLQLLACMRRGRIPRSTEEKPRRSLLSLLTRLWSTSASSSSLRPSKSPDPEVSLPSLPADTPPAEDARTLQDSAEAKWLPRLSASERPGASRSRLKVRLPRAKARKQRQKSEALARDALRRKDYSFETMVRVLEAVHFPMNKTRKNVLPDGVEAVHGMVLGLYAFAYNIGYSDASKKNPNLVRLLSAFCRAAHPDFEFTSIQVNKNYAARPHVDKNNLGNSFIIGLGNYKGGELWAHDDEGDVPVDLTESIRSMLHYRAGVTYRGRTFDINCRWQSFDGNRLHFARPFEGTRYSLVFYTCDRFQQASEGVRRAMCSAGFTFKWSSMRLQDALSAKNEERKRCRDEFETEQKALFREERRREKEELGPCMARTWNKGWGGDCTNPKHADGGDFCQQHLKVWRTHGRVDGPVPEKKRAEMLKWQKIHVGKGMQAPDPLPRGAVILICLNFWEGLRSVAEELCFLICVSSALGPGRPGLLLSPSAPAASTQSKEGLRRMNSVSRQPGTCQALLLRELSELSPSQVPSFEDAPCWSLARELKGKLRNAGRENPEDLALLAMALSSGKIHHEELWLELTTNLEMEMHRMSGSAASQAAYAASKSGHRGIKLYENAGRLLGEEASKLSAMDCAYAAGAFLRGPGSLAEQVVLRGAVGARILELGLPSFDAQALAMVLDALSRAAPSTWGVETLASSVLEEVHGRADELSLDELALVVRSLGYLQPQTPQVLHNVLDHALRAAKDQGGSARTLAMLCQGIAMQPSSLLLDASERLEALLPEVQKALQEKPTAESAAQILWSLSRCTSSSRRGVFAACDEVLVARAAELPASLLVRLAEALAAASRTGVTPSKALINKVSHHLDMKRYDLPPGKLWRAARAFEVLGVPQNISLEERDQPAAKPPRRQGSQKLEPA
ncbi:Zdhhc9 [Symbiodinium microadriaticum]|nr:Zdhhc9 [Symbiodinium microadriaticum]